MPSMPCGSSSTMPFCRTHLAWPGQMNWSMMHWAVLWKSPNWASHRIRALGLAIAKPSSKPAHEQKVSHLKNGKQTNSGVCVVCACTHRGPRTRTASCCRRCTAPGQVTGGSWEYRSSYPRSGRGGRDDGGWKGTNRIVSLIWTLTTGNVELHIIWTSKNQWKFSVLFYCVSQTSLKRQQRTMEEEEVLLLLFFDFHMWWLERCNL